MPVEEPPATEDALFDWAVTVLLSHEGGLCDDPSDPGGLTNWGFALARNPDLSRETLRSMTLAQAKARYRAQWWEPYRWRELPTPVAVKAFDLAVDIGPDAAVRCLQRALRATGVQVAEDGVLGAATIAASQRADQGQLLAAYRSEAAAHYRMVAASHPGQSRDLAGWLNRAYS